VRNRMAALVATLLSLFTVTSLTVAAEVDESLLKVLYLRNFILYTTWPDHRLPSGLVVMSDDTSSSLLHAMRENRVFPLASTRQCANFACAGGASVIFVERRFARWPQLRSQLADKPVLTVSDQPGFAEHGGMIELFRRDRKLRFRINRRAVHAAHLYLSAELLQMADQIIDDEAAKSSSVDFLLDGDRRTRSSIPLQIRCLQKSTGFARPSMAAMPTSCEVAIDDSATRHGKRP